MNDDIRFYRASGEYGFLSNLYKHNFEFEGRSWRCAEDAYQFGKPKDPAVAEWIVSAPKPHLCAAAAHALLAFDIAPDWQQKKVPRMAKVIDAKFSSEVLAEKLLFTYPRTLIEESSTDSFWGIGKKGTGKNMLGILLMATREKIHAKSIGDL
jgi:hypothetical protein